MPVPLIETSDSLGEGFARAVRRLQVRVAGDAVPTAGLSQPLGPFVFLMTRGTRDFFVGRNLIGVVFADAMATLALLVVDRVSVVGERDQPLQWSPLGVTPPAFVLDQPMRVRDIARLINLVLSLRVLQHQPQQRADPGPQRQPPRRSPQAIRLTMHIDVHATGKLATGTQHDEAQGLRVS